MATTAVAQHPHFGYAGEAAPAQMKEAFTVSKAQIDAFRQAVGFPNNRPVQPVNARVVLQ